jgi:phytoene dehydrogenase-like protein
MPRSFYEVVVVGGSLAALTTGALLARRGFRVAVIGHGARGDSYTHDGLALRRGSAFAPWLEAPAFLRAMNELALVPTVRRRAQTREVAWQVVLPRHRLDVHVDPERRLAELDREFPEVHRPVEDFYADLARHHRCSTAPSAPTCRGPPTASSNDAPCAAPPWITPSAPTASRGTSSRSLPPTTRCAPSSTRRPASPAPSTPTG